MASALRAETLLATYPRTRPPLPIEHRESYVEHYLSNRSAERGLPKIVGRLESWMHKRVGGSPRGSQVLELGAGNLNHMQYMPLTHAYDIVEPFKALWEGSPQLSRIRHIYSDIREIPCDTTYDCVFSVAVLEHLEDLPLTLACAGLLLREGGTFRAGFPSEGGLLWGIGWRLTTAVAYRFERGLDYGAIMRHEHLNSADEILTLLKYFFAHVEISRFPFPFRHLSFYVAIHAANPLIERCRAHYVSRLG